MIEIIEPGTKNRINCNFCGALLSYQKDDVKEHFYDAPMQPTGYEKYITCPQCQHKVVLEATR